jgi:hypothetical protein
MMSDVRFRQVSGGDGDPTVLKWAGGSLKANHRVEEPAWLNPGNARLQDKVSAVLTQADFCTAGYRSSDYVVCPYSVYQWFGDDGCQAASTLLWR